MRRRAAAASILSASAVLVVSWLLGTQSHAGSPAPASADATGSAAGTRSTGSTNAGTTGTATGSAAAASGTYTGSAEGTRFGDVQVQITVANGSITDVIALHLTDADSRSVQISNRAAPVLRQEVLSAQSAAVQMVSGATYTSEAYLTSLQSAIDQAGL